LLPTSRNTSNVIHINPEKYANHFFRARQVKVLLWEGPIKSSPGPPLFDLVFELSQPKFPILCN